MAKPQPVALITGGAVRVGRGIVQTLAQRGFAVAFTYHRSEPAAAGLRKWVWRQTGRSAVAIKADLRDPDTATSHIYDEFRQKFSRIDLLVNNASIFHPATLRQTNLKLMREYSSIELEGPLLLCQRFASMLRKSRGHVVNMVDLLAERPHPKYLMYCAAKAALASLTMGLARELAPQVTVNAIAPGVVEWPEDEPASEKRKYLKRVPLRRAGTPQDVANLVHFLATEGSYITGQVIRLDGGRSIT
jgi:pteridine reductase